MRLLLIFGLASLLVGGAPATFGGASCDPGASVGASHDLEEACEVFHDYLHDNYDGIPTYQPAVSTSHDLEDASIALHDLLHDIGDGLSNDCDGVAGLWDAAVEARQAAQVALGSTGLNGSDPTAKALFKDVRKQMKVVKGLLKDAGLI